MLVLTRKLDETIVIGEDVNVRVIKLQGNRVRLGIEAPEDVNVRRGELSPRVPMTNDEIPNDEMETA